MAAAQASDARTFNVSVVGLSGKEKGTQGVGKSCLCNRFMCSHADDFRTDHISEISQSDFIGSVVNSKHFLYWGQVGKVMDDGTSAVFRVVEMTEFSDDEKLQAFAGHAYLKRAVAVKLESKGKVRYLSKDQMALPEEFEMLAFPDKFHVDGFLVVFDGSGYVDGRSSEAQKKLLSKLVPVLVKTKKPVVVAATKCEQGNETSLREMEGFLEKIIKNCHFVEVSAFDDVNVEHVFFTLANLIQKGMKTRCKIVPFHQASMLRLQQLTNAKKSYQALLNERIADFQTTWLRAQKMLQNEDSFKSYVHLQGMSKSKRPFLQHVMKLKEKKKEQKLSEHFTKMPKALAAILPNLDEESTWSQCQKEMRKCKEFDQYFVILAEDSLWEDEDWLVSSDPRIPLSILGLPEAETCFAVHKRDVIARQKRLEMERNLRELLADARDDIQPGMSWIEVNDILSLRDDYTPIETSLGKAVWKEEGEIFKEQAKEDFYEMLVEAPNLFDYARITDRLGDQVHFIRKALQDDPRYHQLDKLDEIRSMLIWNHVGFLQKEPPIDIRFRDVIDITRRRGSLMINSNMWNIKAGDTRLRLLLLGTDGLALELQGEIVNLCSSDFEYVVDNVHYTVETRIIDDQIVSASNFASGEFTPTGCMCIFSGLGNLQYVHKALDGHILASNCAQPLTRLPFRGLPITLVQAVDPDMPEADQQEVAKNAVELAKRLQCGVSFPKGQRADRQTVTSEQAAEAISGLVSCVKHRQTFISVTKRVQPEIRIAMYVMDNDPYSPEQLLAPLLCQQCCWRDPDKPCAVRFQVYLDNSYKCVEIALLSPQGVSTAKRKLRHGYMLVYSAKRRASYNNIRALFDHLPSIPRAIVAVADKVDVEAGLSDPLEDDLELKLLSYGNSLAARTGAMFLTLSPHSDVDEGIFLRFFTEAWNRRLSSGVLQGNCALPSPLSQRLPARPPSPCLSTPSLSIFSADQSMSSMMLKPKVCRHAYEEVDLPFERNKNASPGLSDSHTSKSSEPITKLGQQSTLFQYHDDMAVGPADQAAETQSLDIDNRPPAKLPHESKWFQSLERREVEYSYALHGGGKETKDGQGSSEAILSLEEPFYAMPQNSVVGKKPIRVVSSMQRPNISGNRKVSEPAMSTPKLAGSQMPTEYAVVQDIVTKCDYETVEDAVLLTRQSERDHRRRHNYFSERQSLEKEPEAVQDSLKKTEAEKQDSTPESHQYGTIHADGFDRMLTPPERRRYHPYEEVKLDKGKDKYQSTSNTNVSGRTSPALSDTTSGSESPLLSRRSVPVNVTPTSTARRQKLSIGSLVTQRSLDTDDSGDEMKKKNTRKRVPSQGELSVSSGSVLSTGEDYVLSPRAYRKFSIPVKVTESMLDIYRDDDELLRVEIIDPSITSFGNGEFDNDMSPFLPSDKPKKKSKQEEKERVKLEARRHKEQRKLEDKRRRDIRKEEERLRKWRAKSPAQQRHRGSPVSTYFSIELNELPEIATRGAHLPLFVAKCIKAIEKHGMQVEGLYRVSGKKDVISVLKMKFEADHKLDFDIWAQESVHVLTTALKSFFQELPSPLFPESLIELLCEIIVKPEFDEKLAQLKECIETHLPSLNYGVLRHLIKHLHRVKQHSEQNKMMASNLSVVFWPTLIRPNITNIDKLLVDRNETTNLAEIITTFIEHAHFFFGEDDTPDAATIVEIPTELGDIMDGQETEVIVNELFVDNEETVDIDDRQDDDDDNLYDTGACPSTRRYTDL